MATSRPAKSSARTSARRSSSGRAKRSLQAQALARKLACGQGRRDEAPNVQVGQSVARARDSTLVAALVELLDDRETSADAIKAIYECGYVVPELLVDHTERFVGLLGSRRNRLSWGAMIALSCVARAAPEALWPHRDAIIRAFDQGSVITRDAAIVALAGVAQADESRAEVLRPWFAKVLSQARSKDLPRWAEQILGVLDPSAAADVTEVLRRRLDEISAASSRRKLERRLARFETRQ